MLKKARDFAYIFLDELRQIHERRNRHRVQDPELNNFSKPAITFEGDQNKVSQVTGDSPSKIESKKASLEASLLQAAVVEGDKTAESAKLGGLALSGGGIRSATFNLGILQGLAKVGLLRRFDYLSTVSGGGYIGGWFSAWINRDPNSFSGVEKALTDNDAPRPPQIPSVRHLRQYSNYLTPRLGFLSADGWTLLAIYLRNLLLNLLILMPTAFVLLLLPRGIMQLYERAAFDVGPWMDGAIVLLLLAAFAWITQSLFQLESTAGSQEFSDWRKWITPLPLLLTLASVLICFRFSEVPRVESALANATATENRAKEVKRQAEAQVEKEKDLVDRSELLVKSIREGKPLSVSQSALAQTEELKTMIAEGPPLAIGGNPSSASGLDPTSALANDQQQSIQVRMAESPRSSRRWRPPALRSARSLVRSSLKVKQDSSPAAEPEIKEKADLKNFEQVIDLVGSDAKAELKRYKEQAALANQELAVAQDQANQAAQAREAIESRDQWLATLGLRPNAGDKDQLDNGRFPWRLAFIWSIGFGVVHLTAHLVAALLFLVVNGTRTLVGQTRLSKVVRLATMLFFALLSGALGGFLLSIVFANVLWRLAGTSYEMLTWGPPLTVGVFLLAASAEVGLTSRFMSENTREWWARLGGWLFIYAIGWTALFATALYAPLGVKLASWSLTASATGGWILTTITGLWAAYSGKTGERKSSRLMDFLARLAPPVFVAGLLVMLSCLIHRWSVMDLPPKPASSLAGDFAREEDAPPITTTKTSSRTYPGAISGVKVTESQSISTTEPALSAQVLSQNYFADLVSSSRTNLKLWYVLVGCFIASLLLAFVLDINIFSLHALYANRLVRCYLGATTPDRRPHSFIGLDPNDDIPLQRLAPVPANGNGDGHLKPHDGPYHLINTCLNLVGGEDLAWQERKASSFVLSPSYCGSNETGYRPLSESPWNSISLGKAISISGAAATPNAGYHSSAAVTALMTVFNVRLGWWLPNPARQPYCRSPPWGLLYLWCELFSQTNERRNYVYLSDGGHFDNLGVYELVRRRCSLIVACDAGADTKYNFWDLGAVIHKCRVDFGVEIRFTPEYEKIRRSSEGQARSKSRVAVAEIIYPGTSIRGTLVYIKPAVIGTEPADVLNYAAEHCDFPHETTADQFFSESQFESYRALGEHTALEIFGLKGGSPIPEIARLFPKQNRREEDEQRAPEKKV